MSGSLNSTLALGILLGIFHILLFATLATASRGLAWNLGNRDGEAQPLSLHAARAERATRNFLETFVLFGVAAACAIAIDHDGHLAQLGAQIWFWARVAYLIIYLVGVPVIRSLVWGISLAGILMVVAAII